jgi:hypothetical protein
MLTRFVFMNWNSGGKRTAINRKEENNLFGGTR